MSAGPSQLRLAARRRGLAVAALAAAVGLALITVHESERAVEPSEIAASAGDGDSGDPFAYESGRREELERRAAAGNSHVIYAKSPGGVIASAARTARYRQAIERVAAEESIDPDLMEAMVLLESAGRPEVIAGSDPEAASGLGQILASTATSLLGMKVDLARSRELTGVIAADETRASKLRERAAENPESSTKLNRRARRLEDRAGQARRERRQVDERFDPAAALEGMARYLTIAREEFGRDDLAITSYHMGIGNLTNVIRRYSGEENGEIDGIVRDRELSYARLYFDSSPTRNERTWNLLASFGDDSSTYYWRVLAAAEIMSLWRRDIDKLERLTELHAAKATAEEVFHPRDETLVFNDALAVANSLEAGLLVPIPAGVPYGYEVGPQLGELAEELGVERGIYSSLRPVALATLIYLGARVQAISGATRPLIVTSAVRDEAYQESLRGSNSEATPGYSLHTAGYAFDIKRDYQNGRQAAAFQFVLDRLKSLSVIDWAREPAAIHITVSDLAEPLLD